MSQITHIITYEQYDNTYYFYVYFDEKKQKFLTIEGDNPLNENYIMNVRITEIARDPTAKQKEEWKREVLSEMTDYIKGLIDIISNAEK